MNQILAAAVEFQTFARAEGWSFVFVGGLAVGVHGEVRATQDFDACLFTGFGDEAPAIDSILGRFRPRSADAAEFALQYRVLRIVASNGVPGDVALGALPFEEEMIGRARRMSVAGVELMMPTPEDLLVMKVFAGRPRDWLDVRGILARQGPKSLNLPYVRLQLEPLLDALGNCEAMPRFEQILRDLSPPPDPA